jgi:FdhE protein
MTQDAWLARHPYLRRVADFHAQVTAAVARAPIRRVSLPNWHQYLEDYRAGVPFLWSSHESTDLEPAEVGLVSLVVDLASRPTSEKLSREIRDLEAQLRGEWDAPRRAVAWLLSREAFSPARPGLLRYLGWTVMARYLGPVVDAFGNWREEEHWLRGYCPICGSAPAMSQLVAADLGRRRLLSCGCCGTRWRFQRIGCPFCEGGEGHQLAALAIEAEEGLRIDYCKSCFGYLKTYAGQGEETLWLADWTSLHLDIAASHQGLKHRASLLYEL